MTVKVLTEAEMGDVAELAHVREMIRKLRTEEDTLKVRVQEALAGAEVGEFDGIPVVRLITTWPERFDLKKFRATPGYEDLVAAYTVTSPVVSVRLT